ncbi:MAG: SusE domain-containing protein [Bacteroidota bacterium]|nr:SusE domain-containing protein [Bacteroidota bacterium]
MKTSFVKIVLFACVVFSFAGCKTEDTLKNLNVTAVQSLYEPVNNKSVVLQASATASIYFEWEPALSEDGSLTLYQVAFDKVGGDFSKPLYVATADGNGANTHATITHKQINKIAALAGIASSETGKMIWTVIASKGVNTKPGAVSNTLEVTRLAGFADVPASVYISGEGSEAGTDLSKASAMKSVSDGVFEIYTQLTAGKAYHFTDANVGTPRTFYTDAKGTLLEGATTCTVATTGVYRINLDFSIGASTMTQISKVEFYFCPLDQFQFALDYVANGVWTAKSKPITFKQESWGRDQRYKFRFTTVDSSGNQAYEWWGAPASQDSAPSGGDSYYYLVPADNSQWNDKFKFASEMDGALVDMSVIMSAGGPYTHSVTKVGVQ